MSSIKKLILPGTAAVAVMVGLIGASITNSLQANAATTITATQTETKPDTDQSQGGHVGANGTKEVGLTGDTADKVKAAALAAIPGGTILRMENDAEGATYEAHMTSSDGSKVTVKLDGSFKVTSTDAGMR